MLCCVRILKYLPCFFPLLNTVLNACSHSPIHSCTHILPLCAFPCRCGCRRRGCFRPSWKTLPTMTDTEPSTRFSQTSTGAQPLRLRCWLPCAAHARNARSMSLSPSHPRHTHVHTPTRTHTHTLSLSLVSLLLPFCMTPPLFCCPVVAHCRTARSRLRHRSQDPLCVSCAAQVCLTGTRYCLQTVASRHTTASPSSFSTLNLFDRFARACVCAIAVAVTLQPRKLSQPTSHQKNRDNITNNIHNSRLHMHHALPCVHTGRAGCKQRRPWPMRCSTRGGLCSGC